MNKNEDKSPQRQADDLGKVSSEWGKHDSEHYGYNSDEERLAKRGLEDWELVDTIPESQKGIPKWFIAVIVVVLLIAIGLSLPFWGDRPGYERSWFNWGFGAAILYIAVMAGFVYFMVRLYGSNIGGKLDSDKTRDSDTGQTEEGKDKDA